MTERIELRGPNLELRLGVEDLAAYREAVERATSERWVDRLFERDVSLWSTDPRVGAAIGERLGWLDAPDALRRRRSPRSRDSARASATPASRRLRRGHGRQQPRPGRAQPGLRVDARLAGAARPRLDRPGRGRRHGGRPGSAGDAVHRLHEVRHDGRAARVPRRRVGPDRAGRSPRRTRTTSRRRASSSRSRIPSKSLEAIPHHDDLREVFLNPPDIGGRYSALSYVGLVPASLIGLDLDALLGSAQAMAARCRSDLPHDNPGVALGLALGTLALAGPRQADVPRRSRDRGVRGLGRAADRREHRQARRRHRPGGSASRPAPPIAMTGPRLRAARPWTARASTRRPLPTGSRRPSSRSATRSSGSRSRTRWTSPASSTAGRSRRRSAGAVLGIDPFDQPNVEEAKEHTRRLLAVHSGEDDGLSPVVAGSRDRGGRRHHAVRGHAAAPQRGRRHGGRRDPPPPRPASGRRATSRCRRSSRRPTTTDDAFAAIRRLLRDSTRRATTLGYGPRFLHSTGQLHKGGPPIGWFVQFTADHPVDRPIPGWPYTFGQLIDAQAAGDFQALESHDLPILRVHLGADSVAGLAAFERALADALREG